MKKHDDIEEAKFQAEVDNAVQRYRFYDDEKIVFIALAKLLVVVTAHINSKDVEGLIKVLRERAQ